MSFEKTTIRNVSQESGEYENDELVEYEDDNVVCGVSFVGLGMSLG